MDLQLPLSVMAWAPNLDENMTCFSSMAFWVQQNTKASKLEVCLNSVPEHTEGFWPLLLASVLPTAGTETRTTIPALPSVTEIHKCHHITVHHHHCRRSVTVTEGRPADPQVGPHPVQSSFVLSKGAKARQMGPEAQPPIKAYSSLFTFLTFRLINSTPAKHVWTKSICELTVGMSFLPSNCFGYTLLQH